jgi:hypothetical protein
MLLRLHLSQEGKTEKENTSRFFFLSVRVCSARFPIRSNRRPGAPVNQPASIFRGTVVSRTTKAINYRPQDVQTELGYSVFWTPLACL